MTNYAFQSLFDFTRTTSGTFVGSNGLIQNTAASANLLTWTQQFDNAAWTKGGASVTANSTVAPDGTSTADALVEDAATSAHFCQQFLSFTTATAYTFSTYVKAGTRTWCLLQFPTSAFGVSTGSYFNLSGAGSLGAAVGSPTARTITAVGNGWYRVTITATSTATAGGNVPISAASADNTNSYTGVAGAQAVFLWGAQLQTGSTATDYTRNNGGVYPARFDYDPATLQPKGILIEEQRVNLVLRSAEFGNVLWGNNFVIVTDNTTTSPDGTTNADTMNEGTTNSNHGLNQIYSGFTSGTSYTFTVYAKAGTATVLQLVGFLAGFGSNVWANFDLSAGALGSIGTSTIASITSAGNGWYRCTMTGTATATTSSAVGINLVDNNANAARGLSYLGTNREFYVYGAQLEAGSFATSYIPTVASQVTRTADICSIVAPMFAPWYNQSEGTFVFEGSSLAPSTLAQTLNAITASDGTNNNVQRIGRYSNFWFGETRNGNVQQAAPSATAGSYTQNATAKVAYAYKTNDFALSANGATAVTDTSGTVPTVVDRLFIGNPASELNGHIRSIRYYPVRLADFQLQALTA